MIYFSFLTLSKYLPMKHSIGKILLFVIIINMTGVSCQRSDSKGETVINSYENMAGVYTFKIPSGLVAVFITGKENKELRESMRTMESVKIMLVDLGKTESKDVHKFSKDFISKLKEGGFEEMMTLNESGEKITLMMLEEEEVIKEMMALFMSKDEFLGLSLTGEIDPVELAGILKKVKIEDFQLN
jgi:hypothetical protein